MGQGWNLKLIRHLIELLGRRVGVLYLMVFLIFFFGFGKNFKATSDIRALNRIMPPFDELVALTEKGTPISQEMLEQQELYFKSVLKYMTGFSAAHEMLGVTYFYLEKEQLAEKSLNEAVSHNPEVFWFLYNQGVFYYKKKDYAKAVESFKKALDCEPRKTAMFLFSSKIYLPIFLASKLDFNKALGVRLQQGYFDAYRFLLESYLQLEDYRSVMTYAMTGIQTKLDRQGVYYYYAGTAAYYLKDFRSAIYYLQESVKQNPEYSNALYYLGMSVQAVGKEDLANKFLDQAQKLKTSVDPLQEYLKKKELQIY